MFGYPIEPDYDAAKEERIDRVKWVIIGGTILCIVYLFSGLPFAVEVFQGLVATGLCYGDTFYVDNGNALRKPWLWKAILATIPVHVAYLGALFWSDKALPSVMTKSIVFMPLLLVGFGFESLLFDRIVGHFRPSSSEQPSDPATQP